MSTDLMLVIALLALTVAMFAVNRPRVDAVALIMLTALPFTGVITMEEALAGFSDPNIVLIAALFVIGDGLVRTGVAHRLADLLTSKSGGDSTRLIVLLMLAVGGLGATMSSTGVVAIFVPVVLRIADGRRVAPGELMMPLGIAALTSGMITLVATTPNLVINSELVRQGEDGFRFFTFTPFGLPILALGILYTVFARRWLTVRDVDEPGAPPRRTLAERIVQYELGGRIFRMRLTGQSPLIGRTLGELEDDDPFGRNVLAIEHRRQSFGDIRHLGHVWDLIAPRNRTELASGDILLVYLPPHAEPGAVARQFALETLPLAGADFSDRSQEVGMVEAMVTGDSELVGKSVADARLRLRHGLTTIGLRHGATAIAADPANTPLRIGDTLLLVGPWEAIDEVRLQSPHLAVLDSPGGEEGISAPGRALAATLSLGLMIALMISGVVPNVQAALIACLLMGAFRCIDLEGAYRAIHWKTLVLIVGVLPFSIALQRTGGVELVVQGMLSVTEGAGTHALLGSLFVITLLVGLFISNTATAILMAPVAITMANDLGVSPRPFAMIVALAASAAFMTPVSSPVNAMVAAAGNYRFVDFVRFGAPLTVIVMITSVLLVPWLLPVR
ncbi:MAG TPA: SLC13 family permease [Pseudomonadales bacterium]